MKKHPQLLELNAFFFVSRMSEKYGRRMTLLTVPAEEWKVFADRGFDYLWLMGVWTRSPWARAHAAKEPNLCRAYDLILPDWKKEDVTGSPYAIYGYTLDPYLGAPQDLLAFKIKLNGLGLGLVLDFVPNHLAIDHPWTLERPEVFVSCRPETLRAHPDWAFITPDGKKIAHGRDPYFPPWIDTAQINFWSPAAREAWRAQLLDLAKVADGVRCDMAMLGINDVFQKVWGEHIQEARPETEFWSEVIPEVKKVAPHFIFIAEVYWDLDWPLQQLGFDFTYDKRLYDRMFFDSSVSVRDHLRAEPDYRDKCLRFIENHDEERATVNFGKKKSVAAGMITATVPGLRFFHDGQLEGRRIRTPIHLRREPHEPADPVISDAYRRLLHFTKGSVTRYGDWILLETKSAWEKNETHHAILAWLWGEGQHWKLVVINYSLIRAQAFVCLPEFLNRKFFIQFRDALADKTYDRTGQELSEKGLYVDLGPWQAHLFDFKA
jgi:hypothetical protein